MPVVAVMGAKGGVGTSLVATNLALTLHAVGGAILVDLNLRAPSDDLLLDVQPAGSWADLLPVVKELTRSHIDLVSSPNKRDMVLLAPPAAPQKALDVEHIPDLIRSLSEFAGWVVLDLDASTDRFTSHILNQVDWLLVVATADAPALRGAWRVCEAVPAETTRRAGLVLNQVSRHHPSDPESIASSLGIPLLACLPFETIRVADQVNFGHPVVLDPGCRFSGEVRVLARRIAASVRSGRTPATADFRLQSR